MMYKELAKKIPDRIRSERLIIESDPIDNAQPVGSNFHMQLLFDIYAEFLFPWQKEDLDLGCSRCLNRIRNCFAEMKPHLIELEKQNKLLNGVQS